jgi:hypothetical protein
MNRCPHLRTFHTFVRDGGEWAGNHPPYAELQRAGVRLIFFADDDPQIEGELGSAFQAGFVVGVNIARRGEGPVDYARKASQIVTELGNRPTVVSLNGEGTTAAWWEAMVPEWKRLRPNRWWAAAVEARKDANAVSYSAIKAGGGEVLGETYITNSTGHVVPTSTLRENLDIAMQDVGRGGVDRADWHPILLGGFPAQRDELAALDTIGFGVWTAGELLASDVPYAAGLGPRCSGFIR